MLRRVALVRTDVSEELRAYFIKETRIGELILVTLMMEALSSSETSVVTRATSRKIPEDAILNIVTSLQLNNTHYFLPSGDDIKCRAHKK
jgi:hypothetical protein